MFDPLPYVNLLQGTDSKWEFSYGSTLPLTGMPWGMAHWAPQVTCENNWFFHPDSTTLQGFRSTRQPSPWMGEHGQFTLMPRPGRWKAAPSESCAYDRSSSVFRPDYQRHVFPAEGITVELTPTERGAVFRFTFEQDGPACLEVRGAGESRVEAAGRRLRGFSRASWGGTPKNFAGYYVLELDRDITMAAVARQKKKFRRGDIVKGIDAAVTAQFEAKAGEAVEVRVGLSFISLEQAERNLRSETTGGFDAVHQCATKAWRSSLSRVEIVASEEQKRTFYSCLYRTHLFPHRLHEFDEGGRTVHYSPADGEVHSGVLYADSGTWDTYRTTCPFYTILYPEQMTEILEGMLNGYRHSGWLQEWPSPGFRTGMIGAHSSVLFADAAAKGLAPLDLETAYAALRKSAFGAPDDRPGGRVGLPFYLTHGYLPEGERYALSVTLDYAYDDWCTAQLARRLGHSEDYRELMRRAQNYRHLWDPQVGFMRGRDVQGRWLEPFDCYAWGGVYVEGSAWQCSWAVQHDTAGLADLLGGCEALGAKIDAMLAAPPEFHLHARGYNEVVHEMSEMAAAPFGQYAQSNQPAFHHPYLYVAAGQPWKAEALTRRVCAELYNSGPRGFPGDEDNGSMSAWYILSALGIFPLCPGHPSYALTSPVYERAILHLPGGKTFTISAPDNGPGTPYVQERRLNGVVHTHTCLSHADIIQGGELVVTMSAEPNVRTIETAALPYSASVEEASG